MTQPAPGEWYLATDSKSYCWPDPTPHTQPAPSPGYESPEVPAGYASATAPPPPRGTTSTPRG